MSSPAERHPSAAAETMFSSAGHCSSAAGGSRGRPDGVDSTDDPGPSANGTRARAAAATRRSALIRFPAERFDEASARPLSGGGQSPSYRDPADGHSLSPGRDGPPHRLSHRHRSAACRPRSYRLLPHEPLPHGRVPARPQVQRAESGCCRAAPQNPSPARV
jgi:hypothetical protein